MLASYLRLQCKACNPIQGWNCIKEGLHQRLLRIQRESIWGRKRRIRKNMFAVIKSGGRQYKVSVGDTLEVNRLPVEDGAQVRFEEVLLISDADSSMIGAPLVDDAVVLATALKQARGKKLIVFKYKAKKRYRHRSGHRQELTVLTIDDIVANGKSLVTGEAPRSRDEETPEEDELVAPTTTTETGTPVSEVPETETEQKTTRRRRTGRVEDVEDSESETEEE